MIEREKLKNEAVNSLNLHGPSLIGGCRPGAGRTASGGASEKGALGGNIKLWHIKKGPFFEHPKPTSFHEKIDGCERCKRDGQKSYYVGIYSLCLRLPGNSLLKESPALDLTPIGREIMHTARRADVDRRRHRPIRL
ncbi:hypothetical protein EVAR_96111_1 [Eumeta japonica]|uniref:Uncharacterized protein n=1 Tax=Eumeta variegata TaxID=151549 RepID=A0A4C1VFU9_EUMVA|nr:hypothetical protein EVAR_96111_1 [Eumeta japonica]